MVGVIGLTEIRRIALALPGVEEGTHFRLPSFKVAGKGVVTLTAGDTHAMINVPRPVAEAAAAEDPATYEVLLRFGRDYIGVKADLARAPADRIAGLVAQAWRHRAPKALVAEHDAGPPVGGVRPPRTS